MKELNEICSQAYLYHDVVLEQIEKNKDNPEVVKILTNFDSDCKEAFEEYWIKGEMYFINQDAFEDYAWDCIDDYENIPQSMLGYIDIEKYIRDLKLDFYPVELDGRTFYGRY